MDLHYAVHIERVEFDGFNMKSPHAGDTEKGECGAVAGGIRGDGRTQAQKPQPRLELAEGAN